MKLKRLQLKTSLSLMVFFLSLLTLIAVGIGWNNLYASRQEVNALATRSVEAGREVRNAYAQSRYAQPAAAAQALEEAFKRFDTYLQGEYSQAVDGAARRYQRALYIFGGLIALAILLALAAYLTLSRTVLRPLKQAGAYFDRMASGDLTERIEITADNEIGTLYAALKRMQDSLARIVGTVRHGMDRINTGSQHIVVGNTDLSTRTEEQASALQETAASMEQLASTVKQNADNARQANQLAASASEVAQRGGQAVGEVVTTMQGISASSRKISDIVGVIDSIAFQTNILALNAAVEAARAGEQGKGFAVVAAEVRALAQRSAQAAKEIKGLIDDSVKKVTEGSEQVEQAGATMEEIVVSVARVTDIMGEISAATTEQSAGIDQINRAVAQMDDVTRQNAAVVQEAASLAAALREQVAQVSDAVSVFKTMDSPIIDVATAPAAYTPARKQEGLGAGAGRSGPAASRSLAADRSRAGAPSAAPGAASRMQGSPAIALTAPAAPLQVPVGMAVRAPVQVPAYAGAAGMALTAKAASEDDWEEF